MPSPSWLRDPPRPWTCSVEGAESTTAGNVFIDWDSHTISYSSAGHPPPALLRTDGTVQFLDQATDPPLGARPEPVPRPEVTVGSPKAPSSCCTRTAWSNAATRTSTPVWPGSPTPWPAAREPPPNLADALLADLLLPSGATDDTALVIVRL